MLARRTPTAVSLSVALSAFAAGQSPADDRAEGLEHRREIRAAFEASQRELFPEDLAAAEARGRLDGPVLSGLRLADDDIHEVARRLTTATSVRVDVDRALSDRVESEGVTLTLGLTQPVTLRGALDLIAWRTGAVWTCDGERARLGEDEAAEPRIHYVGDLCAPRGDRTLEPEEIVNLVRSRVARGTWDRGRRSIDILGRDSIFVMQPPWVHEQIRRMLDGVGRELFAGEPRDSFDVDLDDERQTRDVMARASGSTVALTSELVGSLPAYLGELSKQAGVNVILGVEDADEAPLLTVAPPYGESTLKRHLDYLWDELRLGHRVIGGVIVVSPDWAKAAVTRVYRVPAAADLSEDGSIDADWVVDVLGQAIEPESWDYDPNLSAYRLADLIVVHQSSDVHREFDRLLQQLRTLGRLRAGR